MLTICKIFRFEAAHYLPGHKGACARLHGHSYLLQVEVEGKGIDIEEISNPEKSMIIDFSDLKNVVTKEILQQFDHSNLNDYFDMPTAEAMVLDIVGKLTFVFPGLCRVRLYETPDSYAEWKK